MELGQRIRQARLEAGLSQRQLCGDTITRNMLSLIENGSARPSMDTLCCLAARLDKPVSFFLEEQAVTSPNCAVMETARSCWTARNATGVLRALEDYRGPDSTFDAERGLLEYLAKLLLAQQAMAEDRLPYAQSLLQQAAQCQSPYLADDSALQLLLAKAGLPARLDCDEPLLLKAEAALELGDLSRCAALLAAVEAQTDPHWQLLTGLCLFQRQDYAAAVSHLQKAEEIYPAQVIPRLEICFRELGDFKMAYDYACKQRR